MNSDAAITFDGQRIPLRPGQSIGAALLSAGIRSWRTTRKDGSQRGMFCGIGLCYDCLVTVDDPQSAGLPDTGPAGHAGPQRFAR